MVAKVLSIKQLQEMARDIGRLLLKRIRMDNGQVELVISATRMDDGVRVNVQGVLPGGEVLFAIQSDLYSAWLEEPVELNQKITLYRS